MSPTEQRDRYHQLVKDIIHHLASLEIHRAHAHMAPGPVPKAIIQTETAMITAIEALTGLERYTAGQVAIAEDLIAAYLATSPAHIGVLAPIPADSCSPAP